MSIWKELGVTPDILALVDQVEAEAKTSLYSHVEHHRVMIKDGCGLPIALLAKDLVRQIYEDDHPDQECLKNLALLYAAAIHVLDEYLPQGQNDER